MFNTIHNFILKILYPQLISSITSYISTCFITFSSCELDSGIAWVSVDQNIPSAWILVAEATSLRIAIFVRSTVVRGEGWCFAVFDVEIGVSCSTRYCNRQIRLARRNVYWEASFCASLCHNSCAQIFTWWAWWKWRNKYYIRDHPWNGYSIIATLYGNFSTEYTFSKTFISCSVTFCHFKSIVSSPSLMPSSNFIGRVVSII